MIQLTLLVCVMQLGSGPVHCGASLFPREKAEAARIYHTVPPRETTVRPAVGNKKTFWFYNMTVMPPSQYQKSATCFGRGGHCYVYVEDSCWQVGIVDSALIRCNYTERFGHIFDDWVVANYCDDTASYSGRYGYYEVDLPQFLNSGWHTTYPAIGGGTVSRWAADYSRFMAPGKANLDLRFDGSDRARFSVRTVKFDTVTQSKVVEDMVLDSLQNGSIRLFDFGNVYPYASVVIANHSADSGRHAYQYQADLVGLKEEATPSMRGVELAIAPNPFHSSTRICWSARDGGIKPKEWSLKIYNAAGGLVRRLDHLAIQPCNQVVWDGRDARGEKLSPGVYFVEFSTGSSSAVRNCVLAK